MNRWMRLTVRVGIALMTPTVSRFGDQKGSVTRASVRNKGLQTFRGVHSERPILFRNTTLTLQSG
jgi:hypothetical protein